MASLPFSISVLGGAAKADGLMRLDGNAMVLEFQIQDRVLGLLRSELKEVRIPIDEIESVRLQNGWFRRPRFIAQTKTMRSARQIPGSQHGTFELCIDSRHQLAAKNIISHLQLAKTNGDSSQQVPHGLE